ncbi:MAG: hypothetical protein DMG07_06980, partial [Acidobacteria bacterium]
QSYGAAHQGVLGVFVRRAGWGMAWLVLCCWVLVVAARTLKELPMAHPYLTAAADLSIYLAILGALLFALQVGKIGASVFGVLVVGLTLLDLASHVSVRIPRVAAAPGQKSPAVEKVWAMPRAAHYLRSLRQKEVFRVSDYSEAFPPNFGDGWRIEETMGSSATALVRYFAFRGIGWGPGSNASALLNARYFVSRTPVPGMPKVFEDGDAVYRNPRAVPRAFVAERYRVMAGEEEILDWIRSPLFAPGETVILKEEDLNALPAAFLREASRESAGMRVRPLGYTTAAEREREKTNDTELQNLLTVFQAPWGWSNGDDLELSFAPESPLPECYLIVTYYPSASGVSRLQIRVDGASGSTTFSVELPGLESGLPPDLPARAVAKLGPLVAGEFRLRLAKTEACSAYLDSVRVTAALPPAEEQNPGTVAVTSFAPNRIKLAASLTRPAFVVLSEVYYPGWEATVDGRPAPLVNGDYILRAVPVSAGRHEVVLRFRSRPFQLGLTISLTTLATPALVFLYRRRKR